MFLPIVVNNSTGINNCELWFKVFFWDRVRSNEHIGDKMMLPSHFSNKDVHVIDFVCVEFLDLLI